MNATKEIEQIWLKNDQLIWMGVLVSFITDGTSTSSSVKDT